MTDREIRRELLTLLPRLDIEVRVTGGDFDSGLISLRGRRVLIFNPSVSDRRQVELLCRALSREDLSRIFVLPAVRARIESYAAGSSILEA